MSNSAQAIDKLDLSPIQRALESKPRWTRARATRAIAEYRCFLKLSLGRRGTAFPLLSRDADEAWHTHMLFSRNYMADCQAVFGAYLHHEPGSTTKLTASQRAALRAEWKSCTGSSPLKAVIICQGGF